MPASVAFRILFFILLSPMLLCAQELEKVEYFIDADPGVNQANAISISGTDTSGLVVNLNASNLTTGLHLASFRALTDSTSSLTSSFYFAKAHAPGAELTRIEYFIDQDPGIGNATQIMCPSLDTTFTFPINTAPLSYGLHHIQIRAFDSDHNISALSHISMIKIPQLPQQVSFLEYYIDSDPGYGAGTQIPILSPDSTGIAFSINTTNLPLGLHTLHVRSRDDAGNYSINAVHHFVKMDTKADSLVIGEYFFDADPGHGMGITFSLAPSVDTTAILNVNLPQLGPGLHHMYIRTKSKHGWSFEQQIPFVKVSTKGLVIDRGEYFIDADPGFGNGISFGQNPSNPSGITFPVHTADLTIGPHTLYIRVLDSCGAWSLTQQVTFFRVILENKLQSLEWYIDVDPGYDQGTSISLTGSDSTGILIQPNVQDLPVGLHTLHLRSKSENGSWSLEQVHPFIKIDTRQDSIVAAEYFFDSPVPHGEGIAINISPATALTQTLPIDVSTLSIGLHYFYYRSKSTSGKWSKTTSTPFVKYPEETISLVALEYFVNEDPGFNQGAQVALSGTEQDSLFVQVDVSTVPFGYHKLYVRAYDTSGSWSLTDQVNFAKYCQDSIILIDVYVHDTTFQSNLLIQSNGTMNPETTIFLAQEIDLLPGFTVPLGVQFIADNENCPTEPTQERQALPSASNGVNQNSEISDDSPDDR